MMDLAALIPHRAWREENPSPSFLVGGMVGLEELLDIS